MGKRFLKLKKRGNLLVFLVGQSGSGKNSFVEAMKLEDYQYEITGKVKQELKEKKQPINHDIIQPIMHKLYKEDPYWQIPYILSGLKKKDC